MAEKEIIIAGSKVRYGEVCDDGAGVVYIFLHGWGSDHTIFTSLFGLVDCAVALDFPGFGGSSPLREAWGLGRYAGVLREFVEKVSDGREVVFVAHSFGGRVLLQMLSQQGKMPGVRRVICMGLPFTREQRAVYPYLFSALKVAKAVARLLPKTVNRKVRQWWCERVGADDYAALESEPMKKTFQRIINADMQRLAESLRDYDTVFIWGVDDDAAPIADAEAVAERVGAQLHAVAGGDHFPFLGDTAESFQTIFTKSIRL